MDRKNISKITDDPEDRILLAKVWDKLQSGFQKNVPANTGFLSPHQIQLVQYLFGDQPGLMTFGGYPDAERKMYIFLPDYLNDGYWIKENSPVVCLQASFYKDEKLTHRDILGALMGCGITRENIGDILVREHDCDFFVTAQIAPYVLDNLKSAGRVSLHIAKISLQDVMIPAQRFMEIKNTVASVRLDSIIASGFRISRTASAEYILAGKVAVDGVGCAKPDKSIEENTKISIRGLGKIKLAQIGHTTKKGRISVTIHRYQ